jgi:hypothetical protein
MKILKDVFTRLPEWWTLEPDQTVLSAGANTNGDLLNLSARSTTGKWLLAYIAAQPEIALDLTKLRASRSASVTWINPANGSQVNTGTYPTSGLQAFRRPGGWPDALLVVTPDLHP